MKKIFIILALCFGVVALNAQNAKIILNVTDACGIQGEGVWGDGTGYQILLDADAMALDDNPMYYECGQSYEDFEYMIPATAEAYDGEEYCIISGQAFIMIPAGTYDFIIANPGCTEYNIIYFASEECDPAKLDDYNFEANKTYTFTISMTPEGYDCTTQTIEDGIVSISDYTENTCNIYPNPAANILNIDAEGYDSYQITNLLGQIVLTDAMNNHAQINISQLKNGVYFVRLNGDNGIYTRKFVKK